MEEKKIKVSIITVCYNSVNTITQTIQSVVNQSYDNIEYIIIDGGSTDGTLDIIRKYANQITYWVSEPDGGIYDAMNKGIKVATGEVVGIINSDDWYTDNAVQLVVEAFNKGVNAVYGDLLLVNQLGKQFGIDRVLEQERNLIGKIYPHPTVFLRRDIYKKYGLFDTSYVVAADYKLTSMLEMRGIKFLYLPTILAAFRYGGVSNNSRKWRCWIETKKIIRKIQESNLKREKMIDFKLFIQSHRRRLFLEYIYLRLSRNNSNNFSTRFLQERRKAKYIIWGAGCLGHECVSWLELDSSPIECIIDTDIKKQGERINEIPIVGIDQVCLNGSIILITPSGYFQEIAADLITRGYQKNEDFISFQEYQGKVIREYFKLKFPGCLDTLV